jgi:conjugal transfer pilus assembly protein TraW
VLIAAGETFNPLAWVPLSKVIVAFRGTDPRQRAQVAQIVKDAKAHGRGVILLTSEVPGHDGWGFLSDLEQQLAGAVYVLPPQLVDRFHLRHLPSTVSAQGRRLIVTEWGVGAH